MSHDDIPMYALLFVVVVALSLCSHALAYRPAAPGCTHAHEDCFGVLRQP